MRLYMRQVGISSLGTLSNAANHDDFAVRIGTDVLAGSDRRSRQERDELDSHWFSLSGTLYQLVMQNACQAIRVAKYA